MLGLLCGMILIVPWVAASAEEPAATSTIERGRQIYSDQCAGCHGDQGQGSPDAFGEPLVGDWPQTKLTRVIAETMPEGEPEACEGEDAAAVAAYVFDAFYSPTAQMRNAPPRYALSRLTSEQYRQSAADLLAMFVGTAEETSERGVATELFSGKRIDRRKREQQRVDPAIDFDFGSGSPIDGQEDGQAFAMALQTSLVAPETGNYQLRLRTPNAAALWFNRDDQPLIDAKIKSGDRVEYESSVFLLAGRSYDLRIEFYRAEYGSKAVGNTGHPEASLQLLWRRPGRAAEVIPSRFLRPIRVPRQLIVDTPFPPDDSSVGYARGTSVSRAWDEATTDAALAVGMELVRDLDAYAKTKPDAEDRVQKLQALCERIAARALRRPLDEAQRQHYVRRHFEESESPAEAVRRSVLVILKSPYFLYPDLRALKHRADLDEAAAVDPSTDSYAVANRLALAMWDSLPDDALTQAAGEGRLREQAVIRQTAQRMVDEARTRAKVQQFLLHWLHVDEAGEMTKDGELYPEFSPQLVSDLRESLELFLEDVVWGEAADFRRLLTDHRIYLNGRLADFYGATVDAPDRFQPVPLEPQQSAGVLSHPALMAAFAYSRDTSPIHRGVFLARNVLGRTLRPPPEAFAPLSPELHADLSTRQRVALQTEPPACATCHELINPLGFAFEEFDAVGRYRREEKGRPVDTRGQYLTRSGQEVSFVGVRQLAEFLAGSREAHESFVGRLFEHVTKQPVGAYGPEQLGELTDRFAAADFNIRKLLVEIAVVYAHGPQ